MLFYFCRPFVFSFLQKFLNRLQIFLPKIIQKLSTFCYDSFNLSRFYLILIHKIEIFNLNHRYNNIKKPAAGQFASPAI